MPSKASECLKRAAVLVAHHTRFQDVVEFGYTPLVRVFLVTVREPQFVLHVLANSLSELGWHVLGHSGA